MTETLDQFRLRVRSFFDTATQASVARAEGREGSDADEHHQVQRARAWRASLYDAGLAGFGYPTEFGGLGDRPEEQAVYQQESRGRMPTFESFFGLGVNMALPVIRDHGSDELKARVLRPGLRGEEIWCQLYSEPGAGSDLAGLTTIQRNTLGERVLALPKEPSVDAEIPFRDIANNERNSHRGRR